MKNFVLGALFKVARAGFLATESGAFGRQYALYAKAARKVVEEIKDEAV